MLRNLDLALDDSVRQASRLTHAARDARNAAERTRQLLDPGSHPDRARAAEQTPDREGPRVTGRAQRARPLRVRYPEQDAYSTEC